MIRNFIHQIRFKHKIRKKLKKGDVFTYNLAPLLAIKKINDEIKNKRMIEISITDYVRKDFKRVMKKRGISDIEEVPPDKTAKFHKIIRKAMKKNGVKIKNLNLKEPTL